MKTNLITGALILVALLILASHANAQPPAFIVAEIRVMEANARPGNYALQEQRVEVQCKAYDWLVTIRSKGVPGVPLNELTSFIIKAMVRYPGNYVMQKGRVEAECRGYSAQH